MLDSFDDHSMLFFVYPIDDAMIAATRTMQPFQLEPQRMSDPLRVGGEWAVDELDGGRSDLLRQPA